MSCGCLELYERPDAAKPGNTIILSWGTMVLRRARLQVYPTLRFCSKTLAYLAHRAEPRVLR